MDDRRNGRALRLLRQRRGLTQAEVAAVAGVSQGLVSLIERGHLDAVSTRTLRRVFAAVDAGFEGHVSWRGGGLDRLLDEAHARLVDASLPLLTDAGWEIASRPAIRCMASVARSTCSPPIGRRGPCSSGR